MSRRWVSPISWISLFCIVTVMTALLCSSAGPASASERLCPSRSFVLSLARRNGSDSCWAEYTLEKGKSLCISRRAWFQWLKMDRPPSLCGEWIGKWKTVGWPENSIRDRAKRLTLRYMGERQISGGSPPLEHGIERLRERSSALLSPVDPHGIFRRLLLDERSESRSHSFLRTLGFVHLITASGIHLYSLASFVHQLTLLGAIAFSLPVRLMLPLARGLSVLTWFGAWLLCGMRPGMLRPWILVSARALARTMGIRWRPLAPLVVSVGVDGVVALWQLLPELFSGLGWNEVMRNAWAPGRLHYALAVGGGFLGMEYLRERMKWQRSNGIGMLREHLCLAVGSWLLTAIVDAWELQLVAFATPFLSLLTLPVFSLGVYPLSIAATVISMAGADDIAEILVHSIGPVLNFLVSWEARLTIGGRLLWFLPNWAFCAGALVSAGFYLFSSRPSLKRRIGIAALLILIRLGGLQSSYQNVGIKAVVAESVTQLDVGQGDAALVITREGTGLIDAGAERALTADAWLKLLVERSVLEIRWIALTHLDEDHAGGVRTLVRLLPVGCVTASQAQWDTDEGRKLAADLGRKNVAFGDFDSGCVPFPSKNLNDADHANRNFHGSAIWVPMSGGWNYLSMGDAPDKLENLVVPWVERLQKQRPGQLLLKLSHHGAHTSSSAETLALLQPSQAWISVGVGNPYGHPSLMTLERLEAAEIPVHRTDREGALGPVHSSDSLF